MKDSEVLWAAKEYIEKNGWCQRWAGKADGSACTVGAMNAVLYGSSTFDGVDRFSINWSIRDRLFDSFAKTMSLDNSYGLAIAYWNDRPERTKEDVLAALEKTAIALEEQNR